MTDAAMATLADSDDSRFSFVNDLEALVMQLGLTNFALLVILLGLEWPWRLPARPTNVGL